MIHDTFPNYDVTWLIARMFASRLMKFVMFAARKTTNHPITGVYLILSFSIFRDVII